MNEFELSLLAKKEKKISMVKYDGPYHCGITQCAKVWSNVKGPTIKKWKVCKMIRKEGMSIRNEKFISHIKE